MESNKSQRPVTLNDVLKSLLVLTEGMIEIKHQQKALADQINRIQVGVAEIKGESNRTQFIDAFKIINSNIIKVSQSLDEWKTHSFVDLDEKIENKELTGKKIAHLKTLGMSWNVMVEKYNVPKSTLQYRYRQYKKQKANEVDL